MNTNPGHPLHLLQRAACLLLLCLALFTTPARGESSDPGVVTTPHVRASLVSEQRSIEPGQSFFVALHFDIVEGWHTYWKNAGDSGNPPRIEWRLPPGLTAGEIHWPYPQRLPIGPLMNYGYSDEAWLLVPFTAAASIEAEQLTLHARADWLVCKEECIPEEGEFSLTLAVAAPGESRPSDWFARLQRIQQRLPQTSPWPDRIEVNSDQIELHIRMAEQATGQIEDAYFFPARYGIAEHAARQTFSVDDRTLALHITRGDLRTQPLQNLQGVLVLTERLPDATITRAFEIDSKPAAGASADAWLIVSFALLGGLLLNIMPCVFPILSLKALSIVQTAAHSAVLARRNGYVFTLGVLLSFAIIAGILLVLRAGGEAIGWGFQLQSPVFVLSLAWLIFAMGLQFSGVWSFGESWMGMGQSLTARRSGIGAFATGVLAVIVATPCTAPFMGTALGYALGQSAWIAMMLFLCLGLGMALPWLLISLWPGLSTHLPKPGAWMERVKQVLAFPLYATVAWLMWVLAQQLDQQSLLYALLSLVLIALVLWLRQSTRRAGSGWRRSGVIALLLLVGLMGTMLWKLDTAVVRPAGAERTVAGQIHASYDADTLARHRAEGRAVLVNFTAAWCITCLVNEKVVLGSDEIQAELRERSIVYMKGDWTNRDPAITRMLEQYGRSGVPLYLYFPPHPQREAIVLPSILTRDIVLQALNPREQHNAVPDTTMKNQETPQ